ncbi:HD family phosphohydrolase [Rossellomorea aquimaris]|uniref:HD family phosphohydrolase n=1 Tax=Rossellomorea aquimaris TaxID=189382 RepID=A0A5D4TSA0_9BACI|nr:HD family phosphohydrolase [Rossellomorea aquimaris]TYS77691.1 HD family phosphohydrolase [Rossellomorea aquimaris]TYS86874.1 HD family phosphohydrolase [Rossellomorea aquimaris]
MQTHPFLLKIRSFLSYRLFTNLLFVLLGIIVFGVLFGNVKPKTLDINLYEEAPTTIRAPKKFVDDEATEKKKEEAKAEVANVYTTKEGAVDNSISLLRSLIESVNEVKKESSAQAGEEDDLKPSQNTDINDQLKLLKAKLPKDKNNNITNSLSDDVLKILLVASEDDLSRLETIVSTQMKIIMENGVKEEELNEAKLNLEQRITNYSFEGDLSTAAVKLGKVALEPTLYYDADKTDELKKLAEANVQKVEIIEGGVIVEDGELITSKKYSILKSLGMVENTFSFRPYIGLALFVLVVISSLYYFFYTLEVTEERKQNYLILTSIVFVISLLIMKIVGLIEQLEINDIAFIFPAAFTGMILRILLNERIAMMMVFILSACSSIVFHQQFSGSIDIEIAIYTLFSGVSGILFLVSRNQRSNILRAGIYVALVNILILGFLILLSGTTYSNSEYVYYLVFALVSGISSSILTIGFLPFFEAGFGILSSMRLVELSSPTQPLLKKLLTDAPGTYHHSVMVANLAESACESIGANGLLARVGCYYHDVGKSKRPHFFIENQLNMENPHDRVSPETSRDVIISHASDGADMLRKHKLPKEIVDIAEQHHGTTLLKFFYYKAKEQGKDVKEEDYRYPGPKPQTREAAIISIADSVEAAVRSKKSPTQGEIQQLVHSIVQDRLQDGQFNECDISLKQLETVKKSLCETLNGIFHPRIEYPELKAKGEKA